MKKLTTLALLLGSSALSLMATGTAGCDSMTSGCGAWWNNYTLGVSTDGVFAQSAGVGLSYTANYTSVSASQDSLSAIFPWTSQTLTTSNTSADSGFGGLLINAPSLVATTSNTSTAAPVSNFGSVMFNAPVSVSNIASSVSTNTSVSTSLTLYSQTAGSYSNYLAQVYGTTYGNRTYTPNSVGNADLITPEPGSYLSVGLGFLLVANYARRRRISK